MSNIFELMIYLFFVERFKKKKIAQFVEWGQKEQGNELETGAWGDLIIKGT